MATSAAPLLETLPGLVNAHTHSPYGPYCRGLTRSAPFEVWMADIMAREARALTPAEVEACALVTGLENLAAGNTALIDQHFGPQSQTAIHGAAQAYETLGLRAWVFVTLSDLPYIAYTREAYPGFAGAIPERDLPADLVEMQRPALGAEEQLARAAGLIRAWRGERVRVGLALSNPVWCSDALLRGAAQLARELESPLSIHAEESPLQRAVSLAQWGLSGVGRLAEHGLLGERTLLAHVVQLDEADIALLARHRASVSHNPVSNLKLQNGLAPLGRLVRAGVNVCLGSDGHASGDSQNLFTVLKFVAALAGLNGLRELPEAPEHLALRMAIENGRRLWFAGDPERDFLTFTEPLGPYAPVWDEPAAYLDEVYVDGVPRLAAARARVAASGARQVVAGLRAAAAGPDRLERAARWEAPLRAQALSR
ncbi:MAG: amidohydrolase family protein [Anaerolineales bacterium]|nr:amidohydrolase family protein [Anaerolineales bacterium]